MSTTRPGPATATTMERGDALAATEVALVAFTVATAFGFCRLFQGWDWLAPLALAGVTSHLVAIGARRRGWSLPLAALASMAALALLVSLMFFRDVSFWGLPTHATWDAVGTSISDAWSKFPTAVALVKAETGFEVSAVLAIWVAAFLADSFAFRAAAGPETLLPNGILFVFASALAAERLRLLSAAVFLGTAALTFALHRTLRSETGSGWLTAHRHGAVAAAARVGAGLGLSAVALGLVIGPALPGAGQEAVINTRNHGDSSRQTISPLVDIQGRLSDRSDTEAFSVKSTTASYWRLTALTDFDGRVWTSTRGYRDASGELAGALGPEYTAPVEQTVTIGNLASIWLPAAYAPTHVSLGKNVRYDPETSSLVTKSDELVPGQTYTVASAVPKLTPAELAGANGQVPDDMKQFLALPADFPPEFVLFVHQMFGAATTPYEKALALQNYFRDNFTYNLDVPKGHGVNAIEDFLQAKQGYCEQFAGTYAAFARVLGLPSRVAVGFTQGTLGADGLYHVDGKHAHAWPEVYFTGIGWVPFEPTPSRGAPGADGYTGVPAQQEGDPAPPTTTATTTASTVAGDVNPTPGTLPDERDPSAIPLPSLGPDANAAKDHFPSWITNLGLFVLVVLVLAGLWLVIVPRLVRRRWEQRRHQAGPGSGRALVAWFEMTTALARAGLGPRPSETPYEYAQRVARQGRLDPNLLERLADHVTAAAYGATDLTPDEVDDSDESCRVVIRTLWDRAGRRDRLLWQADPRPLFQPIPGATPTKARWSVT